MYDQKTGFATGILQVFPHKQILFISIIYLLFDKGRKFKETIKVANPQSVQCPSKKKNPNKIAWKFSLVKIIQSYEAQGMM